MNEEKLIRDVLKKIKLPTEIKSVDLSFSDDSTGTPAVWINLHVDDDTKPSAEKINRLRAIRRDIARKVAERQSTPWPYVQFVTD